MWCLRLAYLTIKLQITNLTKFKIFLSDEQGQPWYEIPQQANLVVAMAAEGQGSTQTPGVLTLLSMMPWRTTWTCFPFSNRTFCLYLLLAILGMKTLILQLLHRLSPRTAFLLVRASHHACQWNSGCISALPCRSTPTLLHVHSDSMLVYAMCTKAFSVKSLIACKLHNRSCHKGLSNPFLCHAYFSPAQEFAWRCATPHAGCNHAQ